MSRLSHPALLLLIAGVLVLVALPLQWQSVTGPHGSNTVSTSGLDYPGYDIVVTAVTGLLLGVAAFALATGRRWARSAAAGAALLACMWAILVYLAAGYPAEGGPSSGVTVSVGPGAYVLGAGGLLAIIGAVLSFRGRGIAAAPSGVQPSM